MTDIVDRLMRDKWHISGVDAEDAAAEIDRLRQESSNLRAVNTELLAALQKADAFIGGVCEDLQSQRTPNWFQEGANNAALSMSESMRLIANSCADFDVSAAIKNATA